MKLCCSLWHLRIVILAEGLALRLLQTQTAIQSSKEVRENGVVGIECVTVGLMCVYRALETFEILPQS